MGGAEIATFFNLCCTVQKYGHAFFSTHFVIDIHLQDSVLLSQRKMKLINSFLLSLYVSKASSI